MPKFCYEYPRPALTADVVLIARGEVMRDLRVLLVRRRGEPFAGCWALPGGFVEPEEDLPDAARRELREETGVNAVRLEELGVFGKPGRDPRGWTVSAVFLAAVKGPVDVAAGDDAVEARLFPLAGPEAPYGLAFDHDEIIERARKMIDADPALVERLASD